MSKVVGTKGQVVIDKEIRDRLGIGPGWLALQRLVDDHVEIYFVMPEHRKSLKGSLAKYIEPGAGQGLSWAEIQHRAWAEAARDQEQKGTEVGDRLS